MNCATGDRMPRTKLLSLILLTCLAHNSAHAELQNCPDLKPPRHGGMASGQAGAAIMGPLKTVKAPKRKVSFPEGSLDSVRISLKRTECYGSCPNYTIELMGDGSASYEGRSFVLVAGRHSYDVPKADVECLLTHFRKASFWSLADKYSTDVPDGPTYTVSLTIGGQTKTIVDYDGHRVGMPAIITALEEEIDRIGGFDRWVQAPSDRLEPAIRAGELAVVQDLIARGAILNGPPDVKEAALRSAALSGNPRVVAEILKYNPNVNAQDRRGNTALIEAQQANYSFNKPDINVVAVVRLLLDAGADVNTANVFGDTALFRFNNAEVVNLLIRAGADVNRLNKSGQTALFWVYNAEVVNLLIGAGGQVNIADENGTTPLLSAQSDEAAVSLIRAGADTEVKGKFGLTIQKLAIERKFVKTLELLRKSPR